ncbi:MAG: cupin domain-containing protein [Dongiaceae bacterium]
MNILSRRRLLEGAVVSTAGLAAMTGIARADEAQSTATAPASKPGGAAAAANFGPFRFPLGTQAGKVYPGGWAKEATVAEFPISEGVAGVLMSLAPGALRELHWHANAAEWAFIISGHCRTTIFEPSGRSEVLDFGPGDVWYFPRGYGHSLLGVGPEDCLFVLAFDNGHFSEFATFSVSDWLGHTPVEMLQKNFGVPAATFANFPKGEVYISQGAIPGPLPLDPAAGTANTTAQTHRYPLLAQKPQIFSGGTFRFVSAKEFPVSTTMSGALMTLAPGSMRELHWHPNANEWQYYVKGSARMTVFGSKGRAEVVEFGPGDVGYVPMGYGHAIENTGTEQTEIVLAFDNGNYQEISISEWVAATPASILATNFQKPEAVFDHFPDREVFISPDKS